MLGPRTPAMNDETPTPPALPRTRRELDLERQAELHAALRAGLFLGTRETRAVWADELREIEERLEGLTPPGPVVPPTIQSGAEPFYVLVVTDDSARGRGNPIVWEHSIPEGTSLRSVLEKQQDVGGKYGDTYVAECRIIPTTTRRFPPGFGEPA